MSNEFTWIPFYMEFADKLRDYKERRGELVDIIKDVYKNTGIKLPTLEKDGAVFDIDPFTVFGLFNKGITDTKRITIAIEFKNSLGIKAQVPSDFNGIPILNNMSATFYGFIGDRKENDIDNLWNAFIAALDFADRKSENTKTEFCKWFDIVRVQFCVKWNITIGLFWIRPYSFLNLDSQNREYLKKNNSLPDDFRRDFKTKAKSVPNASDYLYLCDMCINEIKRNDEDYDSFPSFSHYVWLSSKEDNDNNNDNNWYPSLESYMPGIDVENWTELLQDSTVFDQNSLLVIQRLFDIGGAATCKQLSEKYGNVPGFYNGVAVSLAKRVYNKTQCALNSRDNGKTRWWAILFVGRDVNKYGSFEWKMRKELEEASSIFFKGSKSMLKTSNSDEEYTATTAQFLKYFSPLIQALRDLGGSASRKQAHEKVVELMGISEEELSVTNKKSGSSKILNQIDFARNYLTYEGFISKETKGILALTDLGKRIDMTLELASRIFSKWVDITSAKRKGLPIPDIDISQYYKFLSQYEKYTKPNFLSDVFITEQEYDKLRALLLRKKNIILQGAPGVGKTFSAKRLAYSIIGEKNENRICMVQFHQSYSYEDFIFGYRPNKDGNFEPHSGVFYDFCERCKEYPDKPYFFIIDEINRGNLSKIFGELLMLIETDKRGEDNKINIVYSRKQFYIPENLYIIGLMNTADRSLAMIDYALRRRFSFYTMKPAFDNADTNGFSDYTKDIDCPLYHSVVDKIKEINLAIRKDTSLGKGFEIGHSYFTPAKNDVVNDEWVRGVVEYEIIPLIEEYWFDDDKTANRWISEFRQVIGENDDD